MKFFWFVYQDIIWNFMFENLLHYSLQDITFRYCDIYVTLILFFAHTKKKSFNLFLPHFSYSVLNSKFLFYKAP